MKVRITQLDDVEEARELHDLAFPDDAWVGDHHTFWVARDDAGKTLAFASAVQNEESGVVYLSRCAVIASAAGLGLQRRMIRARLRWAKKLKAPEAITYTMLKNYGSLVNLLRCGFRFYLPKDMWVGSDVHYLRHKLEE